VNSLSPATVTKRIHKSVEERRLATWNQRIFQCSKISVAATKQSSCIISRSLQNYLFEIYKIRNIF